MDVLVNSIDIRDLLPSSSTLDPTTPLSAPDLRLLIDRLEIRSQNIKSRVQQYLLSHHQDFSDLFSFCSDSVSKSESLSDDVFDLLRLFSDRPIDVEIRHTVDEIRENAKELRVKKEILELVRVIVGLSEELRSVKEMVRIGNLVSAAKKVKELKKAVRVEDENSVGEVKEPVVYGLLKKEWFDCFEEIQGVLLKFMENVVLFENKPTRVRVKYQLNVNGIEGVELRTVLEAMEVVGILDYGLAKVGDLMIKYVITPAIKCAPISFTEEMNQNSNQMTEVILKMVPSDDLALEVVNGETIYSRVILVIKFIQKYLCLQNGHWMRCFGRLTWPRISELIISNFLSKVVPDDASKLADFQKIIKLTSEFESSLKDMMFISGSDKKDERLSDFADNVEVHFASRKKTEILAKARDILLRCDFSLLQEYRMHGSKLNNQAMAQNLERVVDLLFLSERCVVSEGAFRLMKLVHQTLQDVCLSSPRVGLEFYHAARDALLLYEAIIPIKLERQLDGINQVAVLMHNDCLYLSQEILGLAFEYRSDFPSSIKERVIFVDMAPRLQLMAEEILQRHIQLVCFNLKEAMDGADGFQNTHQMQQYESAKFSIDQVVFILEKIHIIWEPLLPPSIYKKSMCMVLESVVSQMTKDILLLDDMAAEETLQLQRLIHLMLENLSSLLGSLITINTEGSLQKGFTYPLDDSIPSLRKIRKLADLLDLPLKSITTAWESGELVSCGFTLSEMKDFIKAIFTDSPLRKESLWRIENVSF